MTTSFIPAMHLDTAPKDKLTSTWCDRITQYYYYNTSNRSLLDEKNIEEIDEYTSGNINMRPFKKMYKSLEKKLRKKAIEGNYFSGDLSADEMQFTPLPLIQTPFNSATSIIQKIPIEITCTALDPLSATKKKEDVTFLKNKPNVEADLAQLTSQMNIAPMNLGATEHSSIPFTDSPYGLDLSDPQDYDVFVNLLYKLGVESCFETILQIWTEIKKVSQVKLLEIQSQFKYGVSVNRAIENSLTGLPDLEHVYAGNMFTPSSDIPDFSDNTCRYEIMKVTPMELFNYFGNEICDEDKLEEIVIGGSNSANQIGTGYCACNGRENIKRGEFDSFKMQLIRFEVKSIDWIGVMSNPKSKKGFSYFSNDAETGSTCKDKIWGQNTYVFYWLQNTKSFFGIDKLGYSYRTKGQESYQNFSTNIYKSQQRSAVENSIGENKKAQIADIKLQYAIIQSRPSGVYIDLKYLRGAIEGLTDEGNERTLDDLTSLALERNIMIGDTSGFDGKNDGQQKPFMEIPGGLRTEVNGYLQVIHSAQQNIASFTGINQQLTGQSGDGNALIGLEKLRISSSLNALHYANEAIEKQYQNVMNQWAYIFQQGIKGGGAVKQTISDMIGSLKVDIIKRLDEVPLHKLGITISLNQREEERAKFEQKMAQLRSQLVINAADEYMISYIPNVKDKWALLAAKERQWKKAQDKEKQDQYAQQQQLAQQQGQNMVAQENAQTDGKIKQVYAKGDMQSKLLPLQQQLVNQSKQLDALIQQSQIQQRNDAQTQKAIRTLQEKADIDNQSAL